MIQAGARQKPNAHIIRPMKKILTTLTVIAATALGAQGQTTNEFNPGLTGRFTNNSVTFSTFSGNLPNDNLYTEAKLLFAVTGFDFGSEDPAGTVTIDRMTLSGQGITTNLSFPTPVAIAGNTANPTNFNTYTPTIDERALNESLITWNSSFNTATFRVTWSGFGGAFSDGTGAPPGARIHYAVQYTSSDGGQLNTAFGNTVIVAVPEPSTYLAAAGLLGLCLWSARRQIFKLAGASSTSSGDSVNGAA
jgi:hypothetical protein